MKKSLLLFAFVAFVAMSGNSQVLFTSDFESWNDTLPNEWNGSTTNCKSDSVLQYTTSVHGGSTACQIMRPYTQHRRFSSNTQTVVAGKYYEVKYWVRGKGDIRTAIADVTNPDFPIYSTYNDYHNINTTEWEQYIDTVEAISGTAAQIIISVRNTDAANDHLQIDDVTVTSTDYVAPDAEAVSIYELQHNVIGSSDSSSYVGQTVLTGGIVSAVSTSGFWIQNGTGPWSGVYVYNNTNTVAIGDSVTFECEVAEYYNLTELKNVANFMNVSSGNVAQITTVTVAQANSEDYEGVLIKVEPVTCTNATLSNGQWVVSSGSDNLFVKNLIYTFTPVLNTVYTVVGVADYSYSERKVYPRQEADIYIYNSINENNISAEIFPNPASNFINVNANIENATICIYNIDGQKVYSNDFNNSDVINVSNLNSGIYSIVIANNSERSVKSVVIE